MFKSVFELYTYRELVWHMVTLDLKTRYRGSFFGFLWTLLNPLLLMLVMWAVFSRFGRIEEKNYALFLLSGLMIWIFFQQSVDGGVNSIVKQRALIQKIYLPKLVFPVALVLSNLVNLVFFLIAYFIISLFTPVGIPTTIPLVIPAILMLVILATGCSLFMATLNVFFRDFTHLTSVIMRALFYLTPVLYPPDLFGPKATNMLQLNPMYYPVVTTRDAIYYGQLTDLSVWVLGFLVALVTLAAGLALFTRLEHKFVHYA